MKQKFSKNDYLSIMFLSLIYVLMVLLITRGKFMYGSEVDWGIQHSIFPEYFRNLFYSTKELIPNFTINIGAGQNIFYFAYYGLLSPVIMLSYLLPSVSMVNYIETISVTLGILSVILFYKWLKNKNYRTSICFVVSFMFLCTGPLIFQSHRHIMFVSYMPFLILALMGVDKYFEKQERSLLVLSVFLIIMTSYFYSVGSIICVCIYGIYVFLQQNITVKLFLKEALKFAFSIIISILMAAVLLLPTIYVLLNGRGHGDTSMDISNYLFHFGLEYVLYSPYSVGLTAIVILAIFTLFISKNKSKLFLGIILCSLFSFNCIVYCLNGFLYLDGKALIPFLPLYTLTIAMFLDQLLKEQISFDKILILMAISFILAIAFTNNIIILIYIVDALVLLIVLYHYFKKHHIKILMIALMIAPLMSCICINLSDKLITNQHYLKQNNPVINALVSKATDDLGFYRMHINSNHSNLNVNKILNNRQNSITLYSSVYNTNYNNLFYNVFNNNMEFRNSAVTYEKNNILFETFMGVRYLITNKTPARGYKKVMEKEEYTLYKNDNAMPIGFASQNLLNTESFDNLDYPYNLTAFMNNIIVDKAPKKTNNTNIQKIGYKISDVKNLDIKDKHIDTLNKKGHFKLKLDRTIKDEVLLIRINVSDPQSCTKGDTEITINGIKNKLTCKQWKYFNNNTTFDYTISKNKDFDELNVVFSKGHYTIKCIELYALKYKEIANIKNGVDEFKINDYIKDGFTGTVDVANDGYFMFTIPYDKGFKIKVDDKQIGYEKVNKGFIGFPINKGMHNIEIIYEAPYLVLGKNLSALGIILFIIIIVFDIKKKLF